MKIRIGTRGSDLALWQATHVAALLGRHGVSSDIIVLKTRGDLIDDVPLTQVEGKAFFTADKNNERFFNFNAAVAGYLKIAEDPKFADNEHRKDALGLAATLLDNDQQYSRAATLYRRYSDAVADKPKEG